MPEQRRPFFSIANTNESNDMDVQEHQRSAFSGEPPQNMGAASQRLMNMLHELNERLRHDEGDREKLWGEIDAVRDSLSSLENRSDQAESVFLNLENKMNRNDDAGLKNLEKWRSLIEDNQRALYAQIKKVRAENKTLEEGQQNLKKVHSKLHERVHTTETSVGSALIKIGDVETDQKKLSDKIASARANRLKLLKKMEGLEETLTQTQDTLRAKALVMLTDNSVSRHPHPMATKPLGATSSPNTDTPTNSPDAKTFDERHPIKIEKSRRNARLFKGTLASAAVLGILIASGVWLSENKSNLSITMPSFDTNAIFPTTSTTPNVNTAPAPKIVNDATVQTTPVATTLTSTNQVNYAQTEIDAVSAFMKRAPQTPVTSRIDFDTDLPPLVKEIEAKAFAGSGPAQHDLAAIYTAGHGGVTGSYEKAAIWFNEASYNAVPNARYNLGVLTQQGLGVEKNQERAIELYMAASALEHPEAQYNLAIAYVEGVGVSQDTAHAMYYFERAANNGVTEAAYNLGLIHENGLDGNTQPDEALYWYKTSADNGNPEAISALNALATKMGLTLRDVNALYERMSLLRPALAKPTTAESVAPETTAPVKTEVTPTSATVKADKKSEPKAQTAPKASPVKTNTRVEEQSSFSPGSQAVIIAQVQEQLMRAGLYPGPADGLAGPLTEDAVSSYQKQSGLSVTGRASQDLLAHMMKQEFNLKN